MRRLASATALGIALALASTAPALACAALIGPNGAVQVDRTTTLAAYHEGVEHYITSFAFAGGGAEFGSIIPLPGVPTNVEKGGDWTLQRLLREVRPEPPQAAFAAREAASAGDARVLQEVKIDALDVTVLEGGGEAVGRWAKERGFQLTPDFPEILDFYATRSPIFLAARYDLAAARARGQQVGDGTPVHITIPTDNPWVPLRILSAGAFPGETINADIFLLTDRRPALLPQPHRGLELDHSQAASSSLLADLRSDRSMEWVPQSMWLSHLRLNEPASKLTYDLAVDAWGTGQPTLVAAGLASSLRERPGQDLAEPARTRPVDQPVTGVQAAVTALVKPLPLLLLAFAIAVLALAIGRARRRVAS